MKKLIAIILAAVMLLDAGCGSSADARDYPMGNRIKNADRVVASIRHGLANHSKAITITFSYGEDIYEELNEVIVQWMETALEDTGVPTEGDYIRYQYGGYEYTSSYTVSEDSYDYSIVITPEYYCWYFEEEEASEAADELLDSFDFARKASDIEKIFTIYDWLCSNVAYDSVHRKNPYYHKCSTAYAALIQKTATCQGYCTALYRLLKSEGIDCRIVTGEAEEEKLHAWVIVEADGLYYQLDPTWDAGHDEYRYFMAGTKQTEDRTLNEKFLTEEFTARYPLAEDAWADRNSKE